MNNIELVIKELISIASQNAHRWYRSDILIQLEAKEQELLDLIRKQVHQP